MIASMDGVGLLRAGPEGAGLTPGPACYGRGGTRPTVTDAQLVLGRLKPGPYAGGVIILSLERLWKRSRRMWQNHLASALTPPPASFNSSSRI